MLIFGHRGSPGYPRYGENTITSFTKALASGANGLEFDVRRCGDGRLVVIHDDTVNRTTNGEGRVVDLDYESLRRFDAGNGDHIPLLSDVLNRFGGECLLNIELKEPDLIEDVATQVFDRNLAGSVLVSAFDWSQLALLKGRLPLALLSSDSRDPLIPRALQLEATAIHPRKDIVTDRLVAAAHQANLRVHVWTVNDPEDFVFLKQIGADGIFTDFPDRCSIFAS